MRSYFGISIVAAIAAGAVATAAAAQSRGTDQVSQYMPPPGQQGSILPTPAEDLANLQQSYDTAIMMLKKKMDRLTREDGGQLSPAHQASLQQELDAVNRRFRLARR
jgi:hypothetical protein